MYVRIRVLLAAGALSACAPNQSSPLIFGQGITVGISVGASPANAELPEIAIGLKQADIAIVPTVIPNDVSLDGTEKATRRIAGFGKGTDGTEDALSTFGSFSNTTKINEVTLGVFFATGVAAQNLSSGFGCAMSDGKAEHCK